MQSYFVLVPKIKSIRSNVYVLWRSAWRHRVIVRPIPVLSKKKLWNKMNRWSLVCIKISSDRYLLFMIILPLQPRSIFLCVNRIYATQPHSYKNVYPYQTIFYIPECVVVEKYHCAWNHLKMFKVIWSTIFYGYHVLSHKRQEYDIPTTKDYLGASWSEALHFLPPIFWV